jgi:alpha,alpha-trehalase
MMDKTKQLLTSIRKPSIMLTAKDVSEARIFIANHWQKFERHNTKDADALIGLPNPYLVPAYTEGNEFDFNELYYWDSYFMVQALMDEEHKDLVCGILENLVFLFNTYGVIPNASRTYLMGRSQPPFLTSFIWDVYDTYKLDQKWLTRMMQVAEKEYKTVWLGTAKPHARQVHQGLSRYYDINMLHDLAEAESGWDMTPRFKRRALDYLPVDLNSLLYKYETDLARYYRTIGDKRTAGTWDTAARHRAEIMNELMWNSTKNLYYDYDYKKGKQSTVSSLAGFFPLWAGMVDDERAKKLEKSLRKFTQKGGLSATDTYTLNQRVGNGAVPLQWAYPNGWAPLHFIVLKGLQRYGYEKEAKRIAQKWLKTNLDWYNQNGVFLEKYNVVQPTQPPVRGLYPTQVGFGWTNAIFEWTCQQFIDN